MCDNHNDAVLSLFAGKKKFSETYYGEGVHSKLMQELASGQAPKVMVIGCCDSRVAPETLFGSLPGEVFVHRHVAALVLPYDKDSVAQNPVAASVEFAVENLGVEHIIILGHTCCGGIRALVESVQAGANKGALSDAQAWVLNASDAVLADVPSTEKSSVAWSLENLKHYPSVKARLNDGRISVYGWQFDIKSGAIVAYDEQSDDFKVLGTS